MKNSAFDEVIAALQAEQLDLAERSVAYRGGMAKILYVSQLTDRAALSECVIQPLVRYCASGRRRPSAQMCVERILYADSCKVASDFAQVRPLILSGMAVLLFSTDVSYVVINQKKVERRSVPTPQLSYTIRGPQDCFTENLDANLSLIRYRVKDKNLRICYYDVGVRTSTRVAMIYVKDIVRKEVVNELNKRISAIKVDAIGESGELQTLLEGGAKLFPQMGLIERSDTAFHVLMEGKVMLLVDGSGLAVFAPKTFSEFFYSCDDRYDNKYFGAFSRMLRYIALAIALAASSMYVAIISFHTDVLPSDYAISLAQLRANVPFSTLVGTLILEFVMELVREALLRVPKQIGPAIGIVGAIVLGQAAIAAGFFSPVLLSIAAVSLLASFAIPDYTLVTPFRLLKFLLILCTGSFGFFGFSACIMVIAAELVSMDSFGMPFMMPLAPYNGHILSKQIFARQDMRMRGRRK